MAGRGPAPKDPSKLAGHGAARAREAGMRVITAKPVGQPKLPAKRTMVVEGQSVQVDWPAVTKSWWKMWSDSPLSDEFTSTDWSELLTTALLHAAVHTGDLKHAAELRLRVAKFGATPEDRARLRIQFAAADEAENAPRRSASAARERRGPLKAVN